MVDQINTVQDIPVVDRAKILGIWINCDDSEEAYRGNFKDQLDKIQSVCESWNNRNLSISCKFLARLHSAISYVHCLHPPPPPRVVKEYRKIVTRFIWNDKKPKIVYASLIKPVKAGGLHLIDLESRITANFIQWVRRLTRDQALNTRFSMSSILKVENVTRLLEGKDPKLFKSFSGNNFYSALLTTWARFRCFPPESESAIRREPLWSNQFIQWALPENRRRVWQNVGVERVGDVCHDSEGRLLSHSEITSKFGITCSFLDALGLRLSIPLSWRSSLMDNWQHQVRPPNTPEMRIGTGEPRQVSVFSSKKTYEDLI